MTLRRKCILIEEHFACRTFASTALVRNGYSITFADTLNSAVRMLGDTFPDAILLDLSSAGPDPIAGVKTARQTWMTIGLAVTFKHNDRRVSEHILAAARAAGADASMAKPLTEQSLVNGAEAAAAATHRHTRAHALLIEDSRTVSLFVRRELNRAGYFVTAVPNMEEALALFVDTPFDLVLTDIFMPGIGGLAGLTQMREMRPEVGVVVMSAGVDGAIQKEDALLAASRVGASRTLPKPFTAEQLIEAAGSICAALKTAPVVGVGDMTAVRMFG